MNIKQIVNEIVKLDSEDDLRMVFEAYRDRAKEVRVQKDFAARAKFKAGDKVFFDSKKRGRRIVGKIKKVNWSRCEIEEEGVNGLLWTVPLSMLNPVV